MLCVFPGCPHDADLVPVVEFRTAEDAEVLSFVVNGVVCPGHAEEKTDPIDVLGDEVMMIAERQIMKVAGGVPADPTLTRLVYVPQARLLTPVQPGEDV